MIRGNLIVLSIVSSLLVGCGSVDNDTNVSSVDGSIIGLDEISSSNYGTQEIIEDRLIGITREDLIDVWGEADGSLSGLYGDIWDLGDGYELIVYYDDVDSNKVTKVNIYNINDSNVRLEFTELNNGILGVKLDISELGLDDEVNIEYDLEYNNNGEWEYIGERGYLGEYTSDLIDGNIDLKSIYGELNGEHRLNIYIKDSNGNEYNGSGNFIIGKYGLVLASGAGDKADISFGIVGVIESVNKVGDNISINVNSTNSKSTYDKAVVRIVDDTELDGLGIDNIEEGMEVEIEFSGALLESYPVQCNAKSVKLLKHNIEI